MQRLLCLAWVMILALGGMVAWFSAPAIADSHVPAAHQSIQAYEGPQTCASCHPNAAQEVVESLHYQLRGEVPFRIGWEPGKLGGMNGTY
ncbi:MAG: hypothetical protein D6791_10075 [Chloroflexi bacterium]|nr:MAG: hypothetical protein D6791_10075 [Chloroflexota bacterium]